MFQSNKSTVLKFKQKTFCKVAVSESWSTLNSQRIYVKMLMLGGARSLVAFGQVLTFTSEFQSKYVEKAIDILLSIVV